jgi:hypothetical protein
VKKVRVIRAHYCGGIVIVADVENEGEICRYRREEFNALLDSGKVALADIECKVDDLVVAELPAYVSGLLSSTSYVEHIKAIDLRGIEYHGGTTLSSGALPKWDFNEINGFIKVSSVSAAGNWLNDAWHESYVMDLFSGTGVNIAKAVPGYVLFRNIETRQDEVRPCEIAVKFAGNLTYYRDLREHRGYGKISDELVELIEEYPDAKECLLNMFVVYYLTNQEDRHSKNFGIMDNETFAPLYDNGSSLYYAEPDDRLHLMGDEVARVKFLSKDSVEVLKRYIDWFESKPNIDSDKVLRNLDVIDIRYKGLMTKTRLHCNRAIVERRVEKCRAIIG